MGPSIRIDDVTKDFGDSKALDHVNLSFQKGKIHGIIGRNGSGKTVLLKCICGFMKVTYGEICIDEKQVRYGQRQDIAAIIEVPGFINHVSGFKNLEYLAQIHHKINKEQIRKAIITAGLDPDSKKRVGKYSLGMKQRLAIAQAIMEDEPLIILDEPMNGLDNQGVRDVRNILLQQRDKGKTILIASHSQEDISVLCDTITEMDHGSIIPTRLLECFY